MPYQRYMRHVTDRDQLLLTTNPDQEMKVIPLVEYNNQNHVVFSIPSILQHRIEYLGLNTLTDTQKIRLLIEKLKVLDGLYKDDSTCFNHQENNGLIFTKYLVKNHIVGGEEDGKVI